MTAPHIALAGLGSKLQGLTWSADHVLRIGRLSHLDIVLPGVSVDRVHAEIKHQGLRWVLRDLAQNPVYPTLVNHQPLAGKDHVLNIQDIIQIGKMQLKVIQLVAGAEDEPARFSRPRIEPPRAALPAMQEIKATGLHLRVQATSQLSWDQALAGVTQPAAQRRTGQDRAMLALVRANHHMAHVSQLDELLRSILADTIEALHAQRGSIILADPQSGQLILKATQTPSLAGGSMVAACNKVLVQRCFQTGEALLCQDVNADDALLLSRSIRHGAMASIICVLLRTPHKRIGILHLDRGFLAEPFSEHDLQYADAIAASVAVGIESAQRVEAQRDQFIQTVTTLARAAEGRDQYTGDHTQRVTDYSLLLAEELKLPANEKYHIQIGSPLHDIGKIGIDDAVLRKPGKLTVDEFEHMKTHTTKGATMLDAMFHLLPMIPIVRHHHERWDGGGYPDRLAGEQIPLNARIVSVADAFAAMTSQRPYRPALPVDKAFLELVGKAGTHFDPACVYAFLRLRGKVESMMKA